jgi:hypothetical protein
MLQAAKKLPTEMAGSLFKRIVTWPPLWLITFKNLSKNEIVINVPRKEAKGMASFSNLGLKIVTHSPAFSLYN